MTAFDKRDSSFENKFAHDKELQFKVMARRNKLLGLWAAEKMHKDKSEWDAYAKAVVMADFEKPGDDDVLEKVLADLAEAGLKMTPEELRAQMNKLLETAKEQVSGE